MKKAIKLDASGLIYLAKAGLLDLVEDLYEEIIITDAVYQEVVISDGHRVGRRVAETTDRADRV